MSERKDEIKQERRRRDPNQLSGRRQRLYVDESKLDRQNFEYRFVNDDGNRVHALTVNDDWEVVQDRDSANSAQGAQVKHLAGTKEGGASLEAVLLRKRKSYHDEDKAAGQRRIDETEKSLRSGAAPGATNDGQNYIPNDGITLTHTQT